MNPLMPAIGLIFVLPLIAFYLWMFRDMINNYSLSSDERNYWTLAFLVLNVFAAVLYFMQYRSRRS